MLWGLDRGIWNPNLPAGDIEKILKFEPYLVVETGQTPLKRHQLLGTKEFHEPQELFGASGFIAKAGAEALRDCFARLDLTLEVARLQEAAEATRSSSVRTQLAKRIGLLPAFIASKTRVQTGGALSFDEAMGSCFNFAAVRS